MKLIVVAIGLALCVMSNAEAANSIAYTIGEWQITVTDLGLLPGGTASSGLAINNQPVIVGLATDSSLALQRPFWDANTGAIVGFADNFNNGAFGTLDAAIAHHLDFETSLRSYDPDANNVPADLFPGPFEGILAAGVDPLLQTPIKLSKKELTDLVEFVRDGLFDNRILQLCRQLPKSVPSGMALQLFEGCK